MAPGGARAAKAAARSGPRPEARRHRVWHVSCCVRGMRTSNMFCGLWLLASTAGCVSAGKYDAALTDAQRAHAELDATRSELRATQADSKRQVGKKQAELDEL